VEVSLTCPDCSRDGIGIMEVRNREPSEVDTDKYSKDDISE